MRIFWAFLFLSMTALLACGQKQPYDYVITGGLVYAGDGSIPALLDVAVTGGTIASIGQTGSLTSKARQTIHADGLIVSPGFIDPHTHSLSDLMNKTTSHNAHYLTQGVTTVLTGNDGGGPVNIKETHDTIMTARPGTNVGLFVGHNTIRRRALGMANKAPSPAEMVGMQQDVYAAMQEGAFGFSTGLYYTPGSFANTQEIIELTSVLQHTGGVYESHIRDESTYSIGLLAAIEEAIEIGRATNVPVHIAHIKALGVDVWGKSKDVVKRIIAARAEGIQVTADQYPWRASGTRISNALIPNWVKADSTTQMKKRLQSASLKEQIHAAVKENLRIRSGGNELLIVSGTNAGKTLSEVAADLSINEVEAAIEIVIQGDARVASFNMLPKDIVTYMQQPWVMTSSDGTTGHPRKYASYPQKYAVFVKGKKVLTLSDFIHRSTGLVADTFQICGRGLLREGYAADILVFDPDAFMPKANFSKPEEYSVGVIELLVNGKWAIQHGVLTSLRAGRTLQRNVCD